MTEKYPKRPRDLNQWAKHMLDLATGEAEERVPPPMTEGQKFAQSGGLKGGRVRAERLSPKIRSDIAKQAAIARWRKNDS